jgi:integrase
MLHYDAILLTPVQMAQSLDIHTSTLDALVTHGIIPHTWIQEPDTKEYVLRFNSSAINKWMESKPQFDFSGNIISNNLKDHYRTKYPGIINILKKINEQFAPRKRFKGYSLRKVPNKKHGYLYYVRYIRDGRTIPSQWNTRTNNLASAEMFAWKNREQILAGYDRKCAEKGPRLYEILQTYYSEKSPYLDEIRERGRILTKKTRNAYRNFIHKIFVPFLKECGVTEFEELTPPVIAKLQTYLLKKGNKPQTINRNICALRSVFDHLILKGIIGKNIFEKVKGMKELENNHRVRGCHELVKVNGVFNQKWQNEMLYLLSLVIYSTGLRNSEMEQIQVKDLIMINGCRFIDVKKSKTENGLRMAPLHDSVYQKIMEYVKTAEKKPDDFIFSRGGRPNQSTLYNEANTELGRRLGKNKTELEKEHITFYSGRHYWKTLVNAHNLGDVEEYFMGHRVSHDVSKLYNHHDKQGQKMLAKKAKEVFAILDTALFSG